MAKQKITTVEEALAAVKQNGIALKNVPEELKTEEVCLTAFKRDYNALEDVPEKLKTAEISREAAKQKAMAAVKENGRKLEDVPWGQLKLTDPEKAELCLAAVKQNGSSLEFVPWGQLNLTVSEKAEMCLEAVKDNFIAIEYVPEKLITESLKEYSAICLEKVKEYGEDLGYMPEKLKTAKICLEAVKQRGDAFEFVPEKLKTPELCLEAVKQDSYRDVLQYVPEGLKTPEICLEAVKKRGDSLECVPENLKTPEMCLEAVKDGNNALKYVPENLKTAEICREALNRNSSMFQYIPENIKTAEFCLEAARKEGRLLKEVPEKLIMESLEEYRAICFQKVRGAGYKGWGGSGLEFVPGNLITEEMCLEAMKYTSEAFKSVPDHFKTVEMCLEAVQQGVWNLQYVPEALREEVSRRAKRIAVINIGALTLEKIHFEFFKLTEKELNSVPPDTPDRKFAVESDFVTDNIDVYVTIPDHREVPKSIALKLTNIGPSSVEQREAVFNCDGRVSKGELGGIVILHASPGKPRIGQSYRQKAEITLNFENRSETLVCPISRTTTFSMSFYKAYEARSGKIDSVGDINEFTE